MHVHTEYSAQRLQVVGNNGTIRFRLCVSCLVFPLFYGVQRTCQVFFSDRLCVYHLVCTEYYVPCLPYRHTVVTEYYSYSTVHYYERMKLHPEGFLLPVMEGYRETLMYLCIHTHMCGVPRYVLGFYLGSDPGYSTSSLGVSSPCSMDAEVYFEYSVCSFTRMYDGASRLILTWRVGGLLGFGTTEYQSPPTVHTVPTWPYSVFITKRQRLGKLLPVRMYVRSTFVRWTFTIQYLCMCLMCVNPK